MTGVTAACSAMRRDAFLEIGGFPEALPSNFNDVDLCYKVAHLGYRTVWVANCELFHFESQTPRRHGAARGSAHFVVRRWGDPRRRPLHPGCRRHADDGPAPPPRRPPGRARDGPAQRSAPASIGRAPSGATDAYGLVGFGAAGRRCALAGPLARDASGVVDVVRCGAVPAESVFPRLEAKLPSVQKPIQYVGGELNSVVKDWDCAPRGARPCAGP